MGARGPRHNEVPSRAQLVLTEPSRALGEGERAENDAYWTPLACAVACLGQIAPLVPAPGRVLEPSVGGGAWVQACRSVWPDAHVDRQDIDADAPGLSVDGRDGERAMVHNFLDRAIPGEPPDAIIGNPPYVGDLTEWFDRSLERAPIVAYLLRSTALGSSTRVAWWLAHPPAVVWTLAPRPRWQGPGARSESDTCDSVLVLWIRGESDTRKRWLPWVPR